jgi:pyridoxal phosphate enzyme (YggS family)
MAEGVRENIARVEERIANACRRSGRSRDEVRLVAVSKTVPAERIREAYEAGIRDFGENRVQEAGAKRGGLTDLDITWHLIGHLQTNKARTARDLFSWIHSVDSWRVAEKLGGGALEESSSPDRRNVLIEVNLGGESAKSGVAESGALTLAEAIAQLASLHLRGLMLVPPFFEEAERSRPFFSHLRELAGVINSAHLPNVSVSELSMGMSHDFEVAIEEGSTLVRVGTAIFGVRS